MISALGSGLAVGSSLKISQAYGAGDYELVKRRVSSLYAICIGLSLLLLCIIPFSVPLLRLANTPESLIAVGGRYFAIELFGLVITFFNNVYIAIERARGRSKRILYLNMAVMIIKLSLTAVFVYVMNGTIEMIAWATVISQLFLACAAMISMHAKDNNLFGFSLKAVHFRNQVAAPMLKQSIPVVVEKAAFSFGKVVVNSMSTLYGDLVVGALGISNNIGGMTTCPQNGFQEGAAAIISQNRGGGNQKRALEAFYKVMIINIIIGIVGFLLTMSFLNEISLIFSKNDMDFQQLIMHVYRFEAYGAVPLGINASVIALFYGFGETKITLLINIMRVFAFRIPVLWFLQHFTSYGSESVGIVMMVSNTAIAVFSGLLAIIYIHHLKNF